MRHAWLWTPVLLAVIAGASYGAFVFLRPPELPEGFLYGNGYIEGTEVRVSSEVSGRVLEAPIQEGTRVEEGQLLARVDDAELQAQRKRAEAQFRAIESEKAALQEELRTWRHHLETATRQLERIRNLQEGGAVAEKQVDDAENGYEQARGKVQGLEQSLEQADSRLSVVNQEIELIELRVGKTKVRAPISGTVLVKAIEPGELVSPGRVVSVLVDLTRLKVTVYIPEKDIGKIELNDPARVKVDAFPARDYAAVVSRVDQEAQFTPKDVHMPEERTRMVFGVTLRLDNSEGNLKPGMPADAWIRWRDEVHWQDDLPVPRS